MNRLEKRVKVLENNQYALSGGRQFVEIMLYKQKLTEMRDEELIALIAANDSEPDSLARQKFAKMNDEELIALILGGGV